MFFRLTPRINLLLKGPKKKKGAAVSAVVNTDVLNIYKDLPDIV